MLSHASEVVFDVSTAFGADTYLWQVHSSANDRVHSFTLRRNVSYDELGCGVYNESTARFTFFEAKKDFDECQIDASGRYLTIKEQWDGRDDIDTVIEDLQTGERQVLADRQGGGGHSDEGFGYLIGEDNWYDAPGALRLWFFDRPLADPAQGHVVYRGTAWAEASSHVSHTNAVNAPPQAQFACSTTTFVTRPAAPVAREGEVYCFRLDGSEIVLVAAPTLVDVTAPGGRDYYSKLPKGNLDPTGEYFIWTTNAGTNRLDAFLVRLPYQLLVSQPGVPSADTMPPAVEVTLPRANTTVTRTVLVGAKAIDNVGVVSVQFKLDGQDLGPALTAAPYQMSWDTTTTAKGAHTLTAVARDAAGNQATSPPVTVVVQPPA